MENAPFCQRRPVCHFRCVSQLRFCVTRGWFCVTQQRFCVTEPHFCVSQLGFVSAKYVKNGKNLHFSCHQPQLLCHHIGFCVTHIKNCVTEVWNCVTIYFFWLKIMNFDNKTLLIIGLIIGGVASLYTHQTELASAIFGGMVGYLSKDSIRLIQEETEESGEEWIHRLSLSRRLMSIQFR